MGELMVGVTTGIYMAAHTEELATTIRKLGYAFTRGTDCIEMAGDVPHEINHMIGQEIRRTAKSQGLTLTFHGSLTTPMTVAERSDWRDAHDHMEKSVKSAVHGGCKYTLFHACLHYWFELLSYTSGKMEILMCDFDGKPLSEILYRDEKYGSKKLQDWWIEYSWNTEYQYNRLMLSDEEITEVSARIGAEFSGDWIEQTISSGIRKRPDLMKKLIEAKLKGIIESNKKRGTQLTGEDISEIKKEIEEWFSRVQLYKQIINDDELFNAINDELTKIRKDANYRLGELQAKKQKTEIRLAAKDKMNSGTDENRHDRKWNVEHRGKYVDAYNLIAHYMFFNKDPMWLAFEEVYEETLRKYGYYDYDHEGDEKNPKYGYSRWLDKALDQVEENNERDFKEFFYGVVGARIVQGHMERLYSWMNSEKPGCLLHELKTYEDGDELVKIAKEMKITIEIPDSRDAKYAGLYILWRPKQLYALVKTLRKIIDPKKFYITWDFEHLAGQGVDPTEEMEISIKPKKEGGLGLSDLGKYTLSIHCNKPNPLHGHVPLELGDEEVYKLLYLCRTSGMGYNGHDVYLFFERGGGQDPFKQSVDALKLMAEELRNNPPTNPKELPLKTYGLEMTAGDVERQKQIVLAHRHELVKELMSVPEEEWGFLSGTATRKGKTKEWKSSEMGS